VRGTRFDPEAFLSRAGEGKTITKLKAGEIIYKQGEPATMVYYLQTGRVKVTVISEHGKEAVVGILEPGQFFGESTLDGAHARLTTVVALLPSVITEITKDTMMNHLVHEPAFLQLFIVYLLHRNSRIEADLMDQLFNSSEKRLARLLLLLAKSGANKRPHVISPDISQEMLAEMIGTTRPRVNHFMNKFRKLGLIKYNGEIEVNTSLLDAALNQKLGEKTHS
jgi:CRP/FNR family transcriptional regulator, cyclic AMP receptor protein